MRTLSIKLAWFTVMILTSARVASAENRTIQATRCSGPLVIDGKLDEAAWKNAPRTTDFTVYCAKDQKADPPSELAVLYDDEALYLALIAHEPNMAGLKAKYTGHPADLKVYNDDCFEVMLSPAGSLERFFQFLFNANGGYGERKMIQGGGQAVRVVKELQVAGARLADRWIVEARIPFCELDLLEGASDTWLINVARDRRAGGEALQISTLFPTSTLLNTGSFGKLGGVKANFKPFQIGLLDWTPKRMTPEGEGRTFTCEFETRIDNETGTVLCFEADAMARPDPGAPGMPSHLRGILDHGEKRGFRVSLPACREGKSSMDFRLYDARSKRMAYHTILALDLKYDPFSVYVDRPRYRSAIYATMKVDEILLGIKSDLPEKSWQGRRLELSLRDAAGQVVSQRAIEKLTDIGKSLALPIPKLKPGEYECRAELKSGDGRPYASRAPLYVYPSSPEEIRIDDFNRLVVNGKPVFPLGAFSARAEQAAALGLDHVGMFWTPWLAQLEDYRKKGVRAFGYACTEYAAAGRANERLSEAEKAAVVKTLAFLKSAPGMLMYYLADEPDLVPVLPERLGDIYELCRREDPYHPAFVNIAATVFARDYVDTADFLMTDPYPGFGEGAGFATGGPTVVSSALDNIQAATDGRKMKWIVPQAFDWGPVNPGQRGPTFWEERCMTYLGLIHGARAVSWYCATDFYNYPDLRVGIPALVKELRALERALLAVEEPAAQVETIGGGKDMVHVLARRDADGELTILACNVDARGPAEARIRVAGAGDQRLLVVAENRCVEMKAGEIQDPFRPCEAHVYTTVKAAAFKEVMSVAEAERKVKEEDTRRADPKNLTFFRGLKSIRVSDSARYPNPAMLRFVFDGYTDPGSLFWNCAPKDPGMKEVWLEASFDQPHSVARVEVTAAQFPCYRVELFADGKWQTVTEVKDGPKDDFFTHQHPLNPIANCVKLRFTAFGGSFGGGTYWDRGKLIEIAAYEK